MGKGLKNAIKYMELANKYRSERGVKDYLSQTYTRLFYQAIPSGYHADYGLKSKKFCITHPKYGTVAM